MSENSSKVILVVFQVVLLYKTNLWGVRLSYTYPLMVANSNPEAIRGFPITSADETNAKAFVLQ